jgi:hypothetical protein
LRSLCILEGQIRLGETCFSPRCFALLIVLYVFEFLKWSVYTT